MNPKVAVLTSQSSWYVPHAKKLVKQLNSQGYQARLFNTHEAIPKTFDTVFVLSYFRIISAEYLSLHQHNLVVHESDLPSGKGWSPLFWQILEGKNQIPIVLFEATKELDAGLIYLKQVISLKGNELYEEIREKQAKATQKLCLTYLKEKDHLVPSAQKGTTTVYSKRTAADSELAVDKTIAEQFNQLRIANNVDFPAYFSYKDRRYILHISCQEGV